MQKERIRLIVLASLVSTALMLQTQAHANHVLRATKYYPNHNCGMVTADGSRINIEKVHNFQHKWVALSQDMFRKGYRLGDLIHVTSKNSLLNGIWTVKDKMGPRARNSIDFLMTRGNSKAFANPCKVTIRKVGGKTRKKKRERKRRNRS